MTDALFDATAYGPARAARKPGTPPEAMATIPVHGPRWNGVSRSTLGVCHYVVGLKVDQRGNTIAGQVSACGLVVVPHTYADDEVRPGCAVCAARMKRG